MSTVTPKRSFSTMSRVKTYLRATMSTERLSGLVLMHAYKDITTDGEAMARVTCDQAFSFLFQTAVDSRAATLSYSPEKKNA